ncbi:MAG: 8-amino-7-oxononanoate synthase, partial [Elusimicrobiota bacterium]
MDLCSNDYLGLSDHPGLRKSLSKALERLPLGSTGSRLVRGNHPAFRAAEERFARFKGAQAALLFSSGYLANLGLLQALAGPRDTVFSDELNHASLIDGMRLSGADKIVYPHLDLAALERALKKAPKSGRRLIVTESLFSMEGDIAPLVRLAGLAEEHGALLIVDEAHAVGVYGPRGSGLLEEQGVRSPVVSVNTCGKALGLAGAAVCGPREVIDLLVNRSRSFIFSTAMPPFMAEGLVAAVDLVERAKGMREKLLSLSLEARAILSKAGLPVKGERSQILPILVGKSQAALGAAQALRSAGFDIRAIRPPTVPEGTARLRMTLTLRLDAETSCRATRFGDAF